MAHEIDEDRYIGAQPAWHGIGTYPGDVFTAADAIAATGLDYEVRLAPIFTPAMPGTGGGPFIQIQDKMATVRMDVTSDDPRRILGVVGKSYTVLPNERAFDFFDAVVGEGKAIYESVGVLRGGKEIFVVARLPDSQFWVGDDEFQGYVTLTNGHTGQHGVRVFLTMTRVVCANTLTMALRNVKRMVTLRHTARIESRLKNVPILLGIADKQFRATQEIFRQLAATPIPAPPMFTAYVDDVFPSAGASPNQRTLDHRDAIHGLMAHPHQQTGHEDTYYAAFQSVVQYADHGIPRYGDDPAERAEQALFGRGKALKARALSIAQTHAAMHTQS